MAGDSFEQAAEGQQNWAIRFGAEPIDIHMFGRNNGWDNFVEDKLGITAGVGSFANHLYVEVGKVDDDGGFSTLKRIHGFSINQDDDGNLLMAKEPDGRSFLMVVDGVHTPFSMDPIYQDDPHSNKVNQLQHADAIWANSDERFYWVNDPENDATRIAFQGSEREVLQLYNAMIVGALELNNQDLEYGALGGEGSPNGNSHRSEMIEKLDQVAEQLGIHILPHNPKGWDPGKNDVLETSRASIMTTGSLSDLRDHTKALEIAASEQLKTVIASSNDVDLNTTIPTPPGGGGTSPGGG